jgi:hypothetical protein
MSMAALTDWYMDRCCEFGGLILQGAEPLGITCHDFALMYGFYID